MNCPRLLRPLEPHSFRSSRAALPLPPPTSSPIPCFLVEKTLARRWSERAFQQTVRALRAGPLGRSRQSLVVDQTFDLGAPRAAHAASASPDHAKHLPPKKCNLSCALSHRAHVHGSSPRAQRKRFHRRELTSPRAANRRVQLARAAAATSRGHCTVRSKRTTAPTNQMTLLREQSASRETRRRTPSVARTAQERSFLDGEAEDDGGGGSVWASWVALPSRRRPPTCCLNFECW